MPRFRRGLLALMAGCALCAALPAQTPAPAQQIEEKLRDFRVTGSVLLVGAHPDDEDSQLIAWLARGRNLHTAYLSVTRGDGGQNLLGPVFGPALGLVRTHELLAARAIDGAQQFFTRAVDFGFSKDYHEALSVWGQSAVLGDVVRVYRTFRPDVVIAVFPFPPTGVTHGHHTASAELAGEAFALAGDPKAYPEQLTTLKVWQPRRLLLDNRGGGGGAGIHIDIGGADPVTGESFSSIAARSRSMHKTQGMGNTAAGGGGARPLTLSLVAGAPAAADLMDGVDTTWAREPGGAALAPLADALVSGFRPADPAASVPAILDLRRRLAALPADAFVTDKSGQLSDILALCLGLEATTTMANPEVVPGAAMTLHESAARQASVPVRWIEVDYPALGRTVAVNRDLGAVAAVRDDALDLPASTPLSQPYWLRTPGTPGMFQVEDAALIGTPDNPPVFPVRDVFEVGGQRLEVEADPTGGARRAPLAAIAPVDLNFDQPVELFAPGQSRPVSLRVAVPAGVGPEAGSLRIEVPAGWRVEPAQLPFRGSSGYTFQVTAPAQPAQAGIGADAAVNGRHFNVTRQDIDYPHLPPLLLQPQARMKAVALNLAHRGQRVGYLDGAGDDVAAALRAIGYTVVPLNGAVTSESLRGLDSVVVGVRALNVRTDLGAVMPALFAFAQGGGTVVEQYDNPQGLQTAQLAPYPLHLSQLRVTDENAAMTVLAPGHPALNTPNKITAADFDGWVQERGLYFADTWDPAFTPLFACHDAGEPPLPGGLLVARYGSGYWVYTGFSFFRQLPAGNPGAYRLFANLVSLGH